MNEYYVQIGTRCNKLQKWWTDITDVSKPKALHHRVRVKTILMFITWIMLIRHHRKSVSRISLTNSFGLFRMIESKIVGFPKTYHAS